MSSRHAGLHGAIRRTRLAFRATWPWERLATWLRKGLVGWAQQSASPPGLVECAQQSASPPAAFHTETREDFRRRDTTLPWHCLRCVGDLLMPRISMWGLRIGLLLFAMPYPSVFASEPAAEVVQYQRDVLPILTVNCLPCHGPDEEQREADLRLDQPDSVLLDRGGYAVVVPGQPDQSEFYRRIVSDDADLKMPPTDSGKSLTGRRDPAARSVDRAGGRIHAALGFHTAATARSSKRAPARLASQRDRSLHPCAVGKRESAAVRPSATVNVIATRAF